MEKRTADMGNAPIAPLLLKLSIPGVIGMLVMALYNVVDTFWVAGLPDGSRAIAALTVVFPLQMIAGALGIGTGVGVASLVSRRFGEGNVDEVNDVGGHAVLIPILCGLSLAVAGVLIPEALINLFGSKASIQDVALTYLTAVCIGFPFLLFNMTVNGLYRGAGNTTMPMVVMASSAILNAALDPFLIYGWGPFPRLEVQGAAIATVIAQVAGFLVSATYLWSGRSGYHVRVPNLRFRVNILRDIAYVGAPAAAMQMLFSIVVTAYNWVLGGYGASAIAAYGLTFRMLHMVFPWMFGVTQGLLPIVGFNFGARKYRRMWEAVKVAAVWSTGIAIGLGGSMWLLAPVVVRLFTRDEELARTTVMAMRIVLVTLPLTAPQIMGISALQGLGMGPHAMFLAVARQLVFLVPGIFALSALFGISGAFAAQPVADFLAFFVTAACVWWVYRRYPPSVQETTDAPEGADLIPEPASGD